MYPLNKKLPILFVLLLIIPLIFTCQKHENKILVASYKDIKITLSDFERSYFSYWQALYKPDTPELRRWFVKHLIEQELISQNFDTSANPGQYAQLKKLVSQNLSRFLRRRYLEKNIKDTLSSASGSEIMSALQRKNKELLVNNFYTKDKKLILEVKERINNLESFEMIVQTMSPEQRGKTWDFARGWIKWGDLELAIENILYKLPKGSVSEPIQSMFGWHIFRIDSHKTTIEFNQSDQIKAFSDMQYLLNDRRLSAAAAPHLRDLVWSKKLVVSMQTIRKVWNYLQPRLPQKPGDNLLISAQNLQREIPIDLKNTPVAWIDKKPFMVEEFIEAIPDLPRNLIHPNLKKAVEIAIRDKIITEEAIRQGFLKDPVIKEKLRRTEIAFSYNAILSEGIPQKSPDTIMEDWYHKNKSRFIESIKTEVEEILVSNAKKAVNLAKQINDGADFAALAKQHSLRIETKMQGGYLGWLKSDDGPIGKKAAKLQPGQLFAPVKTTDGFSIIRVINKKISYRSFENSKSQIKKEMAEEYYKKLHQSLLPKSYNPDDIQFYEENISKALTKESKTIF